MTLIKKTALLVLLIALLLLAVLAVKAFREPEQVAQYLVAALSNYELKIDGDLALHYADGWVSFAVADGRLLRKPSLVDVAANSPKASRQQRKLLAVEGLEAKIKVAELLKANVVFDDVNASGLTVFVDYSQNKNSLDNADKPTEQSPHKASAAINWQLGKLAITDATVTIEGFSEPQQLTLDSMLLTGFDAGRHFSVAGRWNDYPLTAKGQLQHGVGFLKAQAYSDRHFQVDATASLAGVQLQVSGQVAGQSSAFDVALSTADFSQLSTMIGVELPELGVIDFTSRVKFVDNELHVNGLSLSIDGPDLALTLQGDANRLANGYQADLTWSVQANDLGKLDMQGHYPLLTGWQIVGDGALSYANDQADIKSTTLQANQQNQQLSLAVDSAIVTQRNWQQFDATLHKGLVSYAQGYETPPHLPALAASDQRWQYRYPFENITLSLSADKNFTVSTQGIYKDMPLSLSGQWLSSGRYYLAGTVDDAAVDVKGTVNNQQMSIVGKLAAPSLSLFSVLLDRPLIAVNSAELFIDVVVADDKATMKKLDVLLKKDHSRIAVQGSADDFFTMDDYRFDVTVSNASMVDFQQWLSTNDHAIENTVSALTHSCSLASAGDKDYCQQLVAPMQWLSDTTDLLSIKHWLGFTTGADGHLLASLSVVNSASKLTVLMPDIRLSSERLNVAWQGELSTRQHATDIMGDLSVSLANGVVEAIKTDVALTTKISLRGDGPLQLTGLTLTAGNTQLAADIDLQINRGELASVSGQLNFQQLDLHPYFPARTLNHTQHKPQAKKPTSRSVPNSAIPDVTLDYSWLPSQNLMLDLSIATLDAPGFQFDKIKATIKRSKHRFEINPFSAMLGGGLLRGRLVFIDEGLEPQLAVYFDGRELPAGGGQLFEDLQLLKSGRIDTLIDVSSSGTTLKDLLARATGRVSLVTHDITMNGSGLDEISPGVITEINQRINPFSRKKNQDTQVECGLVHFDIASGLMTANKSIVLVTPNISFGAHGIVDFNDEALRFQLVPRTRKGLGLSFTGSFAKMAVVSGYLYKPKVEFDPVGALTSSSIDVAGTVLYGPAYWLYLGQAQKLLASAKACERAIDEYAPVFSKPVDKNIFFDTVLPDGWRGPVESWLPF